MTLDNIALKTLRKQKKLTQTELANQLNISQKSYSNWESGKSEPTLDNIVKLAHILNTTTDELLGQTLYLRDDSVLEFSDRLKILRKQRGLTQQKLASLLNINRVSYARWETGAREPRLEIIVQLAKILDTTPNELLGWR